MSSIVRRWVIVVLVLAFAAAGCAVDVSSESTQTEPTQTEPTQTEAVIGSLSDVASGTQAISDAQGTAYILWFWGDN